MGQSLVRNYIHLIFSTKYRQRFIDEAIEQELFRYLGGTCKKLDCNPVQVGGYLDHVHILCLLSKKIALMKLLEEIKSHSSKWIKTKGSMYSNFYWQDGYSAFSVTPDHLDNVSRYIQNQKEHHRRRDYQTEVRIILRKYQVEYDERYIWD
jgi:putative transposase